MKNTSLVLLLFGFYFQSFSQTDLLELYKKGETMTYQQTIEFYTQLAEKYSNASFINMGDSDYGEPIYLFLIHPYTSDYKTIDFSNETTILINNAIHPGEPCGVDATANIASEILFELKYVKGKLDVNIGIIPIYNVGGAHNRGAYSRANQVGPKEHGFRGNARNLDLNRDFIKADSKNTFVFYKIFHWLKPQLFVDTHTSNGADYQYTMTLITSQVDKMHPFLKKYTEEKLNPYIYKQMKEKGNPISPYVNSIGRTPNTGIADYLETPRYSTGYTNLFNCISYVTEAHMLKTYEARVEATKDLLYTLIDFAHTNSKELLKLKQEADADTKKKQVFPLDFELDTTQHQEMDFLGYANELVPSVLTSENRLLYKTDQPLTFKTNYYNHYKATIERLKPKYYIVPRQWEQVIYRLESNGISYTKIEKDTFIQVEAYYIGDYETSESPYEGHYLHKNTKTTTTHFQYEAKKGDLLIPLGTENDYFLMSVLEPDAVDSYFNWNFFDEILSRKEYFSPYVFEEKAIEILEKNPELKADYQSKKADFKSRWEALDYIYRNSELYEKTYKLHPVFRIP